MSEFSIAFLTRKKFSAESHFFQSLNCERCVSDIHVISEITATTPIYSLNFFCSSLRRSLISFICTNSENVKIIFAPFFFSMIWISLWAEKLGHIRVFDSLQFISQFWSNDRSRPCMFRSPLMSLLLFSFWVWMLPYVKKLWNSRRESEVDKTWTCVE